MKQHTNKWLRQHPMETPTGMGYKKMYKGVKKVRPSLVLNLLVLFSIFIAVKQNKH